MKVRSAGALRNQGCYTANVSTQGEQDLQRMQGNTGEQQYNRVTWGVRAADTELLCVHLGPDLGVLILM